MSHKIAGAVSSSLPKSLIRLLAAVLTLVMFPDMGHAVEPSDTTIHRLLVLAPTVVNPDPQFVWLGVGMQRSLVADLTRHIPAQIEASDSSANDVAETVALADKAGADRVIASTVQLISDQIRFTGQILDVKSRRVLTALKVTGRLDDLFEMEDELAAQAIRSLSPPRPAGMQAPPVTIASSGPLRLDYGSTTSQAGLAYAYPYTDDRFAAGQYRYIFRTPGCGGCGWYWGWGCGCGFRWGYSIYPTASPGWAW
jgi:TolB-like protein